MEGLRTTNNDPPHVLLTFWTEFEMNNSKMQKHAWKKERPERKADSLTAICVPID
jgi:hypothetical protein